MLFFRRTKQNRANLAQRSKERGITLIESLLVLGISAAFIAGGVALYNQASTANQTRDAVSELYAVIANLRTTYASAPNFKTLGSDKTGEAYQVGSPPWGGDYIVRAYGPSGATGDAATVYFGIVMEDVPLNACDQIINMVGQGDEGILAMAADNSTTPPTAETAIADVTTSFKRTGETVWSDSCEDDATVMILGRN